MLQILGKHLNTQLILIFLQSKYWKERMSIQNLPPRRNISNYLKSYPKEQVRTNLYKVNFDQNTKIVIYAISLQQANFDEYKMLPKIVENIKKSLQQKIGTYILCGRNIFACNKSKSVQPILKQQTNVGNKKYFITLKSVKIIQFSQLSSGKSKKNEIHLNFFQGLVRNFFKNLKFVSIGKSGKFFNPKSAKVLSNSQIILFNGYQTKFNLTQNGLYLQVDSLTRIVQTKTVLDQINTIYSKNAGLSKEQKRNCVKNQLVGKIVMSNYGNSRIWMIKQVVFDFDLEHTKISQQNNLTFVQYYENTYGLTIKNKRQPVLKAVLNGFRKNKINKQSILIPQFLLLSGLPDDFDQRKRRDISQFTIIQPEQKLNRIEQLIKALNNQTQNFCPNSVSENLGIKISNNAQTVEATILPPPTIQLGRGEFIQKGKVAGFQLFNKQIFKHDVPVNIVVIIPRDMDFTSIQKLFASTCKNLCLKQNLNLIKLNFGDTKKALAQIQKIIEDKDNQFDNFDLNWLIIPPNMKSQYKVIKLMSMKKQNPKVTQVTLTTTLAKKGFATILTKVLIQISSKIGNVPWAPKLPNNFNPRTILIGVDTCKGSGNNVVAYCCTLDKQMTKIHSNYYYQVLSSSLNNKIGDLVSDCLSQYAKINKFLPQEIIIIKADLSDGQKDNIVQTQINHVKIRLKDIKGYFPKLTFMTANKNSKQKFFMQGRTITNPGYGTLINTKVVSKNYDFYLISQHCNRGTVKPIHYKVLYSDSKIQEGLLQEFIYIQSFNYMNWSGSVRVPSVLQYAAKLCCFVSEHINKNPQTQELNNLLYYI